MKKILLLTIIILATITMLGETKALIIGVGEYDDERVTDLPGAIKDAEQFKETLLSLGIVKEVNLTYITNPSYGTMTSKIYEWTNSISHTQTLILYYSGHGYSMNGEVYITPSDVNPDIIKDTAYNFSKKLGEITEGIKSKETIIIMDACYSGGLVKDKPLKNVTIEKESLEEISRNRGISFLLSSGPEEVSKIDEEGKGYFTYYLIEGMKGKANKDENEYVELKELYEYTKEEVERATNDKQHPMLIGDRNIVIAKDLQQLYDRITVEITREMREGNILTEYFLTYIRILSQQEKQDSEKDEKIRNALIDWYNSEDIDTEILIVMTENALEGTEQEEKEEYTVKTQTKGNCLIKIIPMNELAKKGTVYLDGEEIGTLDQGLLVSTSTVK